MSANVFNFYTISVMCVRYVANNLEGDKGLTLTEFWSIIDDLLSFLII